MPWAALGAAAGLLLSLYGTACDPGEECVAGTEGCACMNDSCLGELACRSGACVDVFGTADDGGDDDGDGGGDDGSQADGGDDGGDDGGTVDACDSGASLTVTGALKTNVANVQFDRVSAVVRHKRDVDEFEDGCINYLEFTLGSGDGCELVVEAHSFFTPQGRMEIRDLRFSADSQCPDFPDVAEGVYTIGASGLVTDGSGITGELQVPDRNASSSCVSGEYHIFLAGTLDGGVDNLAVNPTELVVAGAFQSKARDQSCPTF